MLVSKKSSYKRSRKMKNFIAPIILLLIMALVVVIPRIISTKVDLSLDAGTRLDQRLGGGGELFSSKSISDLQYSLEALKNGEYLGINKEDLIRVLDLNIEYLEKVHGLFKKLSLMRMARSGRFPQDEMEILKERINHVLKTWY
jgi:hypothetical protein